MPIPDLEARLGHTFQNRELIQIALTHRSYHFENKSNSTGHFERLEFLGDAVLDLVLSETLMTSYPEADEGTLSKWRASLVNESSLSEIARAMNLGRHLRLGRSETMNRELAQDRPRILASAFEAVIAALYQDAGLEKVRAFINAEFAPAVAKLDANIEYVLDFKTRFQEWAQKKVKQLPEYRLLASQGPEHAKTFRFEVWLGEEPFGQGEGSSRKAAEQDAARAALVKIGEKV